MDKNWDHIARLEKAIRQKYGEEAIVNPNADWTPDKEKEYIKQLEELVETQRLLEEQTEKVELDGFLINKKLLTRETTILNCSVCSKRLKTVKDDIYYNKFECCDNCYVKYIEDREGYIKNNSPDNTREERWQKGWRPGDK